jgi:hypothetical protein
MFWRQEKTGWASSDDGLLVVDRNADGVINDGKELFGDRMQPWDVGRPLRWDVGRGERSIERIA